MMLTALFFVWLQMRPPQVCNVGEPNCAPIHGKLLSTQIACIKTYEDGFIEYNPCEISAPPTTQFVEPVAQQFKKLAQRAADETGPLGDGPNPPWPDGKILWIDPKVDPHKPWDEVDGQDWPRHLVLADPGDVPAVQLGGHLGFDGCGQSACFDHWVTDYTCADKSRVLLTSEDGKKHCIKFPEAK